VPQDIVQERKVEELKKERPASASNKALANEKSNEDLSMSSQQKVQ
jgi:hypothetical protein